MSDKLLYKFYYYTNSLSSSEDCTPILLGHSKQYCPHFTDAKVEAHGGEMTCAGF